MSWQLVPLKVDWQTFLRSFPSPAQWTGDPIARLTFDDLRQQEAWIACYLAMRKHLPDESVLAIDWLVQATTLDSLPKWKGFKLPTWYKPHRDFDPEDFQGPASGCTPIPRMSPGTVVDMLQCLRLRDPDQVADDTRAAWDRLSGKEERESCERLGFVDADRFLDHLREWQAIMVEIESEKAGYALDLA
jgi:hypothetical protein